MGLKEMIPEYVTTPENYIFGGVLLFIIVIVSHISLLFLVGKLYNRVVESLLTVDMCGIRETEGDTVRYNVMKALQQYEKTSKWVRILLILSIAISFAIAVIFITMLIISEKGNILKTVTDLFRFVAILLTILVLASMPILALMFLYEIPKKIKNTNENYIKAKNKIIDVIEKITNKYGSFELENSKYPEKVKQLYKLLLERWSSRNENGTIEDAKHALTMLSKNGNYEEIFTYLKLDSSLKDGDILRNICKNHVSKCEDFNDALGTFQIYLPQKTYKDFKKFVENRLIVLLIILFIYLLPLLHIIYHTLGAASIGIAIIVFAFFVVSFNYMRL